MEKAGKKAIIDQLHERFDGAAAVLLARYKGLTVEQLGALRNRCREQNVELHVVKNTLARLALEGTEARGLAGHLSGPIAVATSASEVDPAKVLVKYAGENEKFSIVFGSVRGRLLDPDQLVQLSKLPGRDELRAQLLGTLNAVPTQFVRLLSAVPGNFLGLLQNYKRKLEEAA